MNTEKILTTLKKYPVAVAAGLLAVVLFGATQFRSGRTEALEAENQVLQREASIVERNTVNAVRLAEDVESVRSLVEATEDRLMARGQRALNQEYFYRTARQSGVRIVSFRQAASSEAGAAVGGSLAVELAEYEPITFALRAQGSFAEIVRFLGELREGEHFSRINNFTTEMLTEDGAEVLQVALNVDVLGSHES
jgi:uncharacterized DUF497 family protein